MYTIYNCNSYAKIWGTFQTNGAPVNVPATLDHVLDVLPRMPNQLQLHPVKLKR